MELFRACLGWFKLQKAYRLAVVSQFSPALLGRSQSTTLSPPADLFGDLLAFVCVRDRALVLVVAFLGMEYLGFWIRKKPGNYKHVLPRKVSSYKFHLLRNLVCNHPVCMPFYNSGKVTQIE